jgi:hypothetical protein
LPAAVLYAIVFYEKYTNFSTEKRGRIMENFGRFFTRHSSNGYLSPVDYELRKKLLNRVSGKVLIHQVTAKIYSKKLFDDIGIKELLN